MTPIPITFVLMATTKGHFDIRTRYLETIASFNTALPFRSYVRCLAHIKKSPGEGDLASEMSRKILSSGFESVVTEGEWRHGENSHQVGYLTDLRTIVEEAQSHYILVCEDDWALNVSKGEFAAYLRHAVEIFERHPEIMSFRIPRFANEFERINNLNKRHGLNRSAKAWSDTIFVTDDYSANPSIYRTRDLRAALTIVNSSDLPKHVEHGLGEALRILSGEQYPFAVFNPRRINIMHLGTKPGDEDTIHQPLYAELS